MSPAVRRWRIALLGLGLALLLFAAYALLVEVAPQRWLGIALWLGAAIVLHDGVAALAVFAVSVLLRRAPRRVPFGVILVAQGALVVGAIVTVLVLPEVVKQAIGTANASILPLDYLASLGLFYAALAAVSAVLTVVVMLRHRTR